jgi:hypothetical protein
MIHKIVFIVKWILIISILEVMLWTCLSLILMQMTILKDNKGFISYLRIFTYLSYGVIVILFICFIKLHSISNTSTKQLMKDILKTRKTGTILCLVQSGNDCVWFVDL